jgi:hypothetical protein
MTKQDLIDAITDRLNDVITHGNTLTTDESITATNTVAEHLDTVNPDLVKYPPVIIK